MKVLDWINDLLMKYNAYIIKKINSMDEAKKNNCPKAKKLFDKIVDDIG